jgi:hypothetical protein
VSDDLTAAAAELARRRLLSEQAELARIEEELRQKAEAGATLAEHRATLAEATAAGEAALAEAARHLQGKASPRDGVGSPRPVLDRQGPRQSFDAGLGRHVRQASGDRLLRLVG